MKLAIYVSEGAQIGENSCERQVGSVWVWNYSRCRISRRKKSDRSYIKMMWALSPNSECSDLDLWRFKHFIAENRERLVFLAGVLSFNWELQWVLCKK